MSKKNQALLLIIGLLLLIVSTLFPLPSKLVLILSALGVFLFVWAMMLLIQANLNRVQRLCLFLLLVVLLNGIVGLWLHTNHLLLNTPQSHYYNCNDQFAYHIADGVYYSFTTFSHLGCCELIPSNQTSRAISLLVSLSGYMALAFLVVLLNRDRQS